MKSSIILIFLDLAADIMTCLDNSYREKRWVKLGYWIGIDISSEIRNKEDLSNSTDIAKANIM